MKNLTKLAATADAAMQAALDLLGRAARASATRMELQAVLLEIEAGIEAQRHHMLAERFRTIAARKREIAAFEARRGLNIDVLDVDVPRRGSLDEWWDAMLSDTTDPPRQPMVDDLMSGGF